MMSIQEKSSKELKGPHILSSDTNCGGLTFETESKKRFQIEKQGQASVDFDCLKSVYEMRAQWYIP